jgi:hypothetical protein
VAQARLAAGGGTDAAFYRGKLAASRFYARNVLPGIALARKLVEASELDVMELSDDSW